MFFFNGKSNQKNNVMKNGSNIKILIVGLTTVLALSNFSKSDFRKGKIYSQISTMNVINCQNNSIQNNT